MEKILVASQNEVKLLAVEEAFDVYRANTYEFEMAKNEIVSGVADQPTSLIETATGALNRLQAIRSVADYSFYVAIEGGIYSVETPLGTKWYESACAAVADNNSLTIPSIAYGPAFPVPRRIMRHVEDNKDLNQAMELETGIKDIGKSVGFNGWLTENKLDRKKVSAEAVLLALYGLSHE